MGAITMHMTSDKTAVSPGDEITVHVDVDNSRTGHKMPTGSAELRVLLLDLKATAGNTIIPVPASSEAETDTYDIAGRFDDAILKKEIPEGSPFVLMKKGYRRFFPIMQFLLFLTTV